MKHIRRTSRILLSLLGLSLASLAQAAGGPPIAPVRPVVDVYHGVKIEDPYRYFENFHDLEVQAWVKGQADFAEQTLRAIPGREAFLARVRDLDEGAPYRSNAVRRWPDGSLHYLKRLASENLDKLYFHDAKAGTDNLLIDPEKLTPPGGGHVSISFCVPSPDGKFIAYGLAASGSEQNVLHVLDGATGKDLPDVIGLVESDYTEPCWLPDSKGFVYSRKRKLAAGAPPTDGYKKTRAFLHRLGTDPQNDAAIFAIDSPSTVPMTEDDFPSLVLTAGSSFAIGKIKHGDTSELTLYAAPIDALFGIGVIPWKKICDVKDDVKEFAVHGDEVYLLTANGAPRYRVVRTLLRAPNFTGAGDVVPSGERVVQAISVARDALYVNLLDNGISVAARLPFAPDAKLETLSLPDGMTSGYTFGAEPDVDGVFVGTAAWTRAGRVYVFDPATRMMTDSGLRPQGKFDNPEGYVSREVNVPSYDGVPVPLSIVHRADLKSNGSNPTLLTGYGSYGAVMYVHFNPADLAWLEKGGIIAVAHVRGGGEKGKPWHQAGRFETKPNTWKDFIACGEYLVREKYTSPQKLAGEGTSAGGILIGRALTQRPDLFAAAIVNVGCTDALRMETTANGVPNIQEFGSVVTKPGFEALLAMSAYEHVTPKTRYPAVLITHGVNDPRVDPWMSAKLTARLQAATSSGKPVLFRVEYQAGHGIGSTKLQRQEKQADEWAFLWWQLGGAIER